jgi:hypothetical protein
MKFLFFICSVLWLLILNGMTTTPEVKKMQLPNSRWWSHPLSYLNNVVHSLMKVEQNCHFPASGRNCYNKSKMILLFLWSDTWIVLGKPYSAWQWVMQCQPGAGKWQLCSTLSVNTLYETMILYFFFLKYESWFLTLWKEHSLVVFENRVLRRIFGPKKEENKGGWMEKITH